MTARRSGMSVGEWLNEVIQPDDGERLADFDDDIHGSGEVGWREDRAPRERHRHRDRDLRNENVRVERTEHESRNREGRGSRKDLREAQRRERLREAQKTREQLGQLHGRLDKLSRQIERLASRSRAQPQRPSPESSSQLHPPTPQRIEPARELTGAPQRMHQPLRPSVQRRPLFRNDGLASAKSALSIDRAVAEIAARQRVLDEDVARTPADIQPTRTAAPPQRGSQDTSSTAKSTAKPDAVVASPSLAPRSNAEPPKGLSPHRSGVFQEQPHSETAPIKAAAFARELPFDLPPERTVDLGTLQEQLREITTRIESLRPSNELESAVATIRSDLAEIARLITEALPRRAVESLEIEVKALADRIDHSRQSGADSAALAGIERGLNEVRDALRALTPAESLVGYNETVRELNHKLDSIIAKEDPAALQQLEAAIGALRGIVAHVASNETLSRVAEDVRALSAKVDNLANAAVSGQAFSALESRVETLASALTASTEAGQAVPRELERLLSQLIERLEGIQLSQTDQAAVAYFEDRIGALVRRFDASSERLGHLEAVERGIADLLVQIDQIRGVATREAAAQAPLSVGAIERDVAEIKQAELRTQQSLEVVQGTVQQVVGRLAIIESSIREAAARAVPSSAAEPAATAQAAGNTAAQEVDAAGPSINISNDVAAQRASSAKREPIDPTLPPNHPLEPGFAVSRPPQTPSAADRIAASEAVIGSISHPAEAQPSEKINFIAAARRAAQAAAAAPPQRGKGTPSEPKPKQRARTFIVVAAAALIFVGCLRIASHWLEDGKPTPGPTQSQPQPAAPPPVVEPQPDALQSSSPHSELLPPSAPTPLPSQSDAPASVDERDARPAPQLNPHDSPKRATPAAPANDVTGSVSPSTLPQSILSDAVASSGTNALPAGIGGSALRIAALSGDPTAAFEVATRYAEGRGVPQNAQEAATWFERAAKAGLAPAQFRLGGMYEKGIGVRKSLSTARDLYLAAAKKGNGKAMHNLAVLYAEGVDGPADYSNAAHWFREAADHGVTDSQFNLGILYARGIGVSQSYAESYKWFALAAASGDKDALQKRDEVATHLDQEAVTTAQLAVKTWKAEPQPYDAIAVKTPPGGWDTAGITTAPASKPKPRAVGTTRPTTAESKLN